MPTQINRIQKTAPNGIDPELQGWISQVTDAVNSLAGHNGSIPLADHLDLGGKKIMNVGAPQSPTDALSSGIAESKYSVQALAPQLESNTKTGLKSVRRVNDTNQREQSSSWLKDLMSTPPNSNAIYPTLSNSGADVQSVIPSSLFTWGDGTAILMLSRTDLLAKPVSYAIATISCSGNVVTVTLVAASTLVAGQIVNIVGVTPASFNGAYQLTSVSGGGTVLTYQLSLGTLSGSGGTVETLSCWYYYVEKRSNIVHLAGPFSADTAQNRLTVSFDGSQIVAVVVVTDSGGQVEQSGGGGSPITGSPSAGSRF